MNPRNEPAPGSDRTPDGAPALRGRLADNVVHFTRVLRAAGLPVGPEHTLAALRALELVGLDSREQVHAALSAVLIDRHENQPLFDSAFAAFWRDPRLLERLMYLTLPKVSGRAPPAKERARRLEDALAGTPQGGMPPPPSAPEAPDEIRLDATVTYSEQERLRATDFEQMSKQEFEQAQRMAERLTVVLEPIAIRRQRRSSRGAIDLRAMLRASARDPLGGNLLRRRRQTREPPLVVLIDISGSMERYSRIFLHWAHALARGLPQTETLTFGTRLTRITRMLRQRDVDEALAAAGRQVADWAGGTRLGACLHEFNRRWARRLLGGRSTVLLLTDGLDRDDAGELGRESARLHAFAHRVIWLNPLLRFEGFQPRAAGIRALLPNVDLFLPAHNLDSLASLADVLRGAGGQAKMTASTLERATRWK